MTLQTITDFCEETLLTSPTFNKYSLFQPTCSQLDSKLSLNEEDGGEKPVNSST